MGYMGKVPVFPKTLDKGIAVCYTVCGVDGC